MHLLFVGALCFVVACFYTWPLITDPFNLNYDGNGHTGLYTWLIWWRKYSFINGLDYNFISVAEYPFGADYSRRGEYPLLISVLAIVAWFSNELFAYNAAILGAFVLSGLLMFTLMKRYVTSFSTALIAAFAFAFSNYAVTHSRVHINLPQQWLIISGILTLFWHRKRQTWWSALGLGIVLGCTLLMTPYYAYHLGIITLVFVCLECVQLWRNSAGTGRLWRYGKHLGLYVLAAVVAITVSWSVVSVSLDALLNGYQDDPIWHGDSVFRETDHLLYFSSRPWDFVLPSANHPVFGPRVEATYQSIRNINRLDFTSPRFETQYPDIFVYWFWQGSDEHGRENYLGLMNLFFAGAAVSLAVRRKKRADLTPTVADWQTRKFELKFLLVLFFVALAFALPPILPVGALLRVIHPALHEVNIPMPSMLIMKTGLPFRESNRWVVTMMVSLVVWAGLGYNYYRAQLSTQLKRGLLFSVCVCVLFFEYAQTQSVVSFAPSSALINEGQFIAHHPNAVIGNGSVNGQRVHQSPIVSGNTSNTQDNYDNYWYIANENLQKDRIDYVSKMAALSVTHLSGNAEFGARTGLKSVSEVDGSHIYEITADPAKLFITYTPGRTRDAWQSAAEWAWATKTETAYIWNTASVPVHVDITIALSDATPETLTLTRTLSDWPETVIRSGLRMPNPIDREHYSASAMVAEQVGPAHLIFKNVLIQPGETTLLFQWEANTYPSVDLLSIERLDSSHDSN